MFWTLINVFWIKIRIIGMCPEYVSRRRCCLHGENIIARNVKILGSHVEKESDRNCVTRI